MTEQPRPPFRDLVNDFARKGPLFIENDIELNKIRQVAHTYGPDEPGMMILADIVRRLAGLDPNSLRHSPEYDQHYAAAVESVKSHVRYAALMDRWVETDYAALVGAFIDNIPLSTIEAIVQPDVLRAQATKTLESIHIDTTLHAEFEFHRRAAELPLGLGYEQHVYELIIECFRDSPNAGVMRLNTIADLLTSINPGNALVVSEDLARQWFQGFRHFRLIQDEEGVDINPDFESTQYREWYDVTFMFASYSKETIELHRSVWPTPLSRDDRKLSKDWEVVVQLCGAILANYWEAGVPEMVAIDLIKPICKGLADKIFDQKPTLDMRVRRWLWGVVASAPSHTGKWTMGVSWFLGKVRHTVEYLGLPTGVVLSSSNFVTLMGLKLYELIDTALGLLFQSLADVLGHSYSAVVEYFYLSRSILSGLLPEARRRPKAVWALLFTSNFTRLTPGEKFALSCKMMAAPEQPLEYSAWATERISALQALGVDMLPNPDIPVRKFRLPDTPTVPSDDIIGLAPLMTGPVDVNQTAGAFVRTLLEKGVPRGVDNTWFATDERIIKSINRYDVERPPIDTFVTAVVKQAAHALADQYPDMYKGGQYLTPRAALNKVKVKYSPGLPFIPHYRDRKELAKHGILNAIALEAERLLLQGTHPGTCAHCFVKSDVIGLQKLLDGKNIRTVIASDLLSNVLLFTANVEVTRRQPSIDSFVMNAVPRSEGGFRPFYDTLRTYKHVVQADAKEFDSKLAPVLTVDGLTELRSIAYEDSLAKPIIESQIRAAYVALRFAPLVNLQTGSVMGKSGGLMTGQANTSVDNRDSFRLMWISGWSLITGKPCREFFKKNVIGNAGDDDLVGTDEPELVPQILDAIRNNFGVEVVVETEGFKNIGLVGMTIGEVKPENIQYYKINGLPVPDYSIQSDAMALLAKRTDWRVRTAGYHDVAFLMHHIDGVIGSAYQTAHLNDVYEMLGNEYRDELTIILSRFYETVKVEEARGEYGELLSVFIHLGSERQRYNGRTQQLRAWLKSHRFPAYRDIMRIALKPQDVTATKMRKDHSKILSWIPAIPYSERLLYGVISTRSLLYSWIPNHVVRSLPEFKGLDPTFVMKNHDYVIAKFTWLSLYHAQKRAKGQAKLLPKAAVFRMVIRENPYGSAEDPIGFLEWLSDQKNLDELVGSDLEALRAQMVVVTLVYWFVEEIFRSTRNIPGLSLLFNLYALTMRDINRLYAALNYIHMIATGRSSPIISNLMPPDPYAWVKQFAVLSSCLLPRKWYKALMPGLKHVVAPLPMLVELWAGADTLAGPRPYRNFFAMVDLPPTWSSVLTQVRPLLESSDPGAPTLVVAPTGTGKSTAFIAGLFLTTTFTGTIWLLCPTIVSRDIYQNDFLPTDYWQILSAGVTNDNARRLKVLTHGHARTRIPTDGQPGDLVVLDEIHLSEPEMFANFYQFSNLKRIGITATPSSTFELPWVDIFRYPGEKRFKTTVQHVNEDFSSLLTKLMGLSPRILSRALIVVPTLAMVEEIVQTLSRVSLVGYPLSAYHQTVPPSGIIVATTIVDTAVTIQPPPTCLIDFGLTLSVVVDYSGFEPTSTATKVHTSPATHQQRLGRVGRGGDSIAFVMTGAGTGPVPPPRITAFNLLNDVGLEHDLLAAFRVASLIKRKLGSDNFFGYVYISDTYDQQHAGENDLALAVYMFVRGSDGLVGQSLRDEWLDLRLERSEHEIVNIVVQTIVDLGFGDPLRGDYQNGHALLGSGMIGTMVNDRFHPCGAIGLVNRLIIPCGLDPGTLNLMRNSLQVPIGAAYNTRQHNVSLEAFKAPPIGRLIRPLDPIGLVQPHQFICDFTEPDVLAPVFCVSLSDFAERISYEMPKWAVRVNPFVVEIVIGDERRSGLANWSVHLTMPTYTPNGAETVTSLRLARLPPDVDSIVLALFAACGCPDDCVVFWGNIPTRLRDTFRSQSLTGMVVDKARSYIVVRPRYARRLGHSMYAAYANGLPFGRRWFLSHTQYIWFEPGEPVVMLEHDNGVPVTTSDTNTIVGAVRAVAI